MVYSSSIKKRVCLEAPKIYIIRITVDLSVLSKVVIPTEPSCERKRCFRTHILRMAVLQLYGTFHKPPWFQAIAVVKHWDA